MKQLEYPFDANYIISQKRKIKRELLESSTYFVKKILLSLEAQQRFT